MNRLLSYAMMAAALSDINTPIGRSYRVKSEPDYKRKKCKSCQSCKYCNRSSSPQHQACVNYSKRK